MASEVVEVEGHIIDSLILAKVLDVILDAGADYRLVDVDIGRTNIDASRARFEVTADDEDAAGRPRGRAPHPRRQPGRSRRRRHRLRRHRRRAARGLLLHHQPGHRGAHRRPVGGGREPGDGLRARRPPRRPDTAPSPCTGCGSATPSWSVATACGSGPGAAPGAEPVRVHELRRVLGEAQGAAGGPGGRAHAPGPGRGRQDPGRVRAGGGAHRCRPRRGPPGSRRLDRRPLRRQRLRHPRHRVERAGHVAGRAAGGRPSPWRAATATTCG